MTEPEGGELPARPVTALAPQKVLTPVQVEALAAAVSGSVADTTRSSYAASWSRFEGWCRSHGHRPLPADPEALATFLLEFEQLVEADGRPSYAPSTLTAWTAGINAAHRAAGHPPPGQADVVRRVLASIRRGRATAPQRVAPLRPSHITAMVSTARAAAVAGSWRTMVTERRNTALLIWGFDSACRESELVGLDDVDVEWVDEGLVLHVRRSKTDQEAKGQRKAIPRRRSVDRCGVCAWVRLQELLVAQDLGGATAVVRALRDNRKIPDVHVCHRPDGFAETRVGDTAVSPRPVFRAISPATAGGFTDRRIHRETVRQVLLAEARRAGLPPELVSRLGGHSMRAGFVTTALRAGAAPYEVRRQTGHISDRTVDIYRRDDPHVGNPVHLVEDDPPLPKPEP